jgi:serine protein kinase
MTKLKLYDGEKQVGDWDQKHVRELHDEFQDEGMHGISPRFVMNRCRPPGPRQQVVHQPD